VIAGHVTRPSGLHAPVRYELITSALHPICALLLAFRLGISYLPMFFVTTVNTVIFEMRAQCVFCEVITELFNVTLRNFRISEAQIQATSLNFSTLLRVTEAE